MREWRQKWTDLFHAFRIALDLRKLTPALCAVFITVLGLYFLAARVEVPKERTSVGKALTLATVLDEYGVRGPAVKEFARGVVRHYTFADGSTGSTPAWLTTVQVVLVAVVLWAVWSFVIGAIARVAAVEIARDESIEFREAIRFAWRHKGSFFWSPVGPLIFLLLFYLALLFWGVVATWGEPGGVWSALTTLITIVTSPLAILAALGMVFLILGLLGGGHLMGPAMAVEATDAMDAIQRSFSYVFTQPWRVIGYRVTGVLFGAGSLVVVGFFAYLFLGCLFKPMTWGMEMLAGHGERRAASVVRYMKFDTLSQVVNRKFQQGIDYHFRAFGADVTPAYKVNLDFVNDFPVSRNEEVALWRARAAAIPSRSAWAEEPKPGEAVRMDKATTLLCWAVGALVMMFLGVTVVAFPVSCAVSSWCIQYFLLRHRVDGVEFKDVYLDDADKEFFAGIDQLGMKPVES
ncbi:MAG: hypothetical protein HY719_05975 [Planctomycetes bacterium]|nr:hypothetical protein [Planctomycetota bacterium]